jgi:hypothetical protein
LSELDNSSPLMPADLRDPDRLRRRIRAGAPLEEKTCGWAPLAFAVQGGMVEACRILLQEGADPHAGGWDKAESLLCLVAEARYSELSRTIGETGFDINADDMRTLCALLVNGGVDPNGIAPDEGAIPDDKSPLFRSVKNNDFEMVRFLVELGANIDQECDECAGGLTTGSLKSVLRFAANYEREDMMLDLLRLGADDACMKYGRMTGFQRCVEIGLDKVVEYYLRERGEDLDQIAHIVTAKQTLDQLAAKESTKLLLRSFAAESSIASGMGSAESVDATQAAPRRDRGMAL